MDTLESWTKDKRASSAQASAPANRHLFLVALAAFVLIALVGWLFVNIQDRYWQLERRNNLSETARNQATLLENHLLRSMSAARTLAAVLRAEGHIDDFDALARELIDATGVVATLQLAPQGIIRQIYPAAGHQGALGHNILVADRRKSDAFVAIATRKMTIAGPFELVQGGVGLVGREPVFLPAGDSAEDQFWGFASVLIKVEDLLESAELAQLPGRGFAYQIWRYQPDSGEREAVFGAGDIPPRAITVPVRVQNLEWQLSLWPTVHPANPLLWAHIAAVLLAATLGAYLIYFLIRQPYLLSRNVAEKTRLLEIANVQLKENEKHLLRQAHHDPLTGLPNRLLFGDRLQQAITRAERDGSQIALLLIDLDRFKPLNDRWGHAAGDQILVQVGRRLSSCARRSDTVARIGGDEFVMLLPTVADASNAESVAAKIRETLTRGFVIPQGRAELDCSIGVAVFPEHGSDADSLLSHADRAMYEVKYAGRGGYRVQLLQE